MNLSDCLANYKAKLALKLESVIRQYFDRFSDKFITVSEKYINCKSGIIGPDDIIYPDGTKFLKRHPDLCTILVEQKPQIRTVTFATKGDHRFTLSKCDWRLSFPYVIFFLSMRWIEGMWYVLETNIAYRNQPLISMDDLLYQPNLPNFSGLKACLGRNNPVHDTEISGAVNETIAAFWQATFSDEWCNHFFKQLTFSEVRHDEFLGDINPELLLRTWEQLTIDNPLSILNISWPESGTINDCLRYLYKKYNLSYCTIANLTRDDVKSATKETWTAVMNECTGTNTEDLDNAFLEQLKEIR